MISTDQATPMRHGNPAVDTVPKGNIVVIHRDHLTDMGLLAVDEYENMGRDDHWDDQCYRLRNADSFGQYSTTLLPAIDVVAVSTTPSGVVLVMAADNGNLLLRIQEE